MNSSQVTSSRDHALLTITPGCVNRGNLIIEHAVRSCFGFPNFAVEINAHRPLGEKELEAIHRCRALVLPGATLLQPEDHATAPGLAAVEIPILTPGVALRSPEDLADLALAQQLSQTVGSRDPFTHRSLRNAGLESALVGCPTLLLGDAERWKLRPGPVVFSPGLGFQELIAASIKACAAVAPTVALLHAPERQDLSGLGLAAGDVEAVPLDSAEQAHELIAGASVVVTSRIHALLTALVHGTPAFFLGPWYDSRYSLVEYLGVPIEPPVPRRLQRLVEGAVSGRRLPPATPFRRARTLRRNLVRWFDEVAAPLGLPVAEELPGVRQVRSAGAVEAASRGALA
ncbi:MAG: polysaccharide pyruvyl transferase family protein [Acidobacteriota bacterium]|nr:polysaccharide pyruvyl transferase family protein [Acidobacteriota bacterium]